VGIVEARFKRCAIPNEIGVEEGKPKSSDPPADSFECRPLAASGLESPTKTTSRSGPADDDDQKVACLPARR
jgi:hypothetical protein